MSTSRTTNLRDARLDVKVVLSGLWIAMLFVFAYVDIFAFWRADVIEGALAREVPGTGFAINQAFLAFATVYVLIPSLMVVVSLIAPAKINRTANITVSVVYDVTVALTMIGETWVYYLLGSAVEVLLLLTIAATAYRWPRQLVQQSSSGSSRAIEPAP